MFFSSHLKGSQSQIMIISGALSLTTVLCLSLFLLFGERNDGMEHSMKQIYWGGKTVHVVFIFIQKLSKEKGWGGRRSSASSPLTIIRFPI